jgi:type II secretory pathway component GspD/PulD (secretin)
MRTTPVLLLLLIVFPLSAFGSGDDVKRLLDGLFHPSDEVRRESRARLIEMGPDVLPKLLEAIEARRKSSSGRSAPAAKPRGDVVLRIHDVRDLVTDHRSIESIAERARAAGGAGLERVDPRVGGRLIVRGTRAAQVAVQEALSAMRRSADRVVTIEARIVKTEKPALPAGKGVQKGFLVEILGEEEVEKLLEAWAAGEAGEVMNAPRLTCYDQQAADVQIGRQITYVSRFETERAEDGGIVSNPVVEAVFAGVRMSLTPVLSLDGRFVTIDVEVSITTVEDPIATREQPVPGGGGVTVEVQVPEVREVTARTSVTMPDGGSFLLNIGRMPGEGGREMLLLLSAKKTVLKEK